MKIYNFVYDEPTGFMAVGHQGGQMYTVDPVEDGDEYAIFKLAFGAYFSDFD